MDLYLDSKSDVDVSAINDEDLGLTETAGKRDLSGYSESMQATGALVWSIPRSMINEPGPER